MNTLRLAFGFMTILPVAPRDTPMQLASARAYFPLVGLVLGLILVGLDLLRRPVLPALLLSVVLIAVIVALTRALHIDGFMDTCDALLGGFTRERRLETNVHIHCVKHIEQCILQEDVFNNVAEMFYGKFIGIKSQR